MNTRSNTQAALAAAAVLTLTIYPARADYGDSADITVDTRNLTLGSLVIDGPASIVPLQETYYKALLDGVDVRAVTDPAAVEVQDDGWIRRWRRIFEMDNRALRVGRNRWVCKKFARQDQRVVSLLKDRPGRGFISP